MVCQPLETNAAKFAASLSPQWPGIFGTGEMAERIRSFDWSQAPIGPIEQWPETLRFTVNTLLSSHHPMLLWWGKDLIQFYNDDFVSSLGVEKHPSALGQRGRECWQNVWPIIGPQIEAVTTQGDAVWRENQMLPLYRNGKWEEVYWTYSLTPIRTAFGEIGGILAICTETTDTVIAKRQLQVGQQRLNDIFHQAPAFVAVLGGPDHVFEMVNASYQKIVARRDVLGKRVRDAVPEAERQRFITLLDGVYRTGEPFVVRGAAVELSRMPSAGPEVRYLDFVYRPRREADGRISGVIVLGVDVTEKRHAEQLLLQSEKLRAVGRLASSIAHEINNPLASVTNLLYLARKTNTDPEMEQYLKSAEVELRRVAVTTNKTLRFYCQATNSILVTATQLIDDALQSYEGKLINSQVQVERRDRKSRAVSCLGGEIQQILNNLISNAIEAMSGSGGRLIIRSRNATEWKTGRAGVTLTVADAGCGISPETLARIFEPFFTTKHDTGTGLGLWICREIAERHHGTLQVRSRQASAYSGTVFKLFLPSDEVASAGSPLRLH